jgi:hypothetical protein
METERIIPGTPILFLNEIDTLRSDRMFMSEDIRYTPSAMSALNYVIKSVPGILIVVMTSRLDTGMLVHDVEEDMRLAGFSGEIYDCISKFRSIGEPVMKFGRLIENWLDSRFLPDDRMNFAICSESAEMLWHRHSRWVPVNGYYGMLAVQAQMIIDILTGSQENL